MHYGVMLKMKTLTILLLYLLASVAVANEHAPLSKDNYTKLVSHLDKKDLLKARAIVKKFKEKLRVESTWKNFEKTDLLLLEDCSEARYGATKIIESKTTIILQGKFWIRSGSDLIYARSSVNSYVVIHKASMRIIAHKGSYERSYLIE